jgi:molecular chaperone GrpE
MEHDSKDKGRHDASAHPADRAKSDDKTVTGQPDTSGSSAKVSAGQAGPKSEGTKEVRLSSAEYDELLRVQKEFQAVQERLLRSAADFDNAKKRLAREREEMFRFALEGLMIELLPILDNFERALAHRVEDPVQHALWSGAELIYKQLSETLKGRGLARVSCVGERFDPHWHEAVGEVVGDQSQEGRVAEELVAGYQLNGKLLRPAKVKVFVPSNPVQKHAQGLDSARGLPGEEKQEELT